jgi:hypothetical protein
MADRALRVATLPARSRSNAHFPPADEALALADEILPDLDSVEI